MSQRDKTVRVLLTERELTLIRVACLRRLDMLKGTPNLQMQKSYEDTVKLMKGKLWVAVMELKKC